MKFFEAAVIQEPTQVASQKSRRDLLKFGLSAGALSVLHVPVFAQSKGQPIELPKLAWEQGALEPVISANTIGFHYGKHHKGYLDNLNKMIAGTELADASLEQIVKAVVGKADKQGVFNNAAQVWNHNFYWNSLAPKAGGTPPAELAKRIDSAFGSFDEFKKAFVNTALTQFASGWAWLVYDKTTKKLALTKTGNADTPLTSANLVPLAVLDVWEHAYYLDYQNKRADYANAVFDKLFNWRFVEANLAAV